MTCPTHYWYVNSTPVPLASNCCRFSETLPYNRYNPAYQYQRYIDYCVKEPDNIITDTLSCPSQKYDSIDCGDNVYIHYNGSLYDLSYGAGIRLEKWYYGHTRTTEDPGHVFLYSSNDCSGYHIDEGSNDHYISPKDSQLLRSGSVWINKDTLYHLVGKDY